MINKETTLSKDVLYEGRILSLEKLTVRTDKGREAKREVVRHAPGVVILGRTEEGAMIFVEQFRSPLGKAIVELPAGKVEAGEDPLVCARREFQEETGYRAQSVTYLGKAYASPGYTDEVLYLYEAKGFTHEPIPADLEESFNLYEWTSAQVFEKIKDGTICDAKSLAALFLAGVCQHG
ncbi:ADP-ribose pyrophosphatase [Clostridiaceae bacterium JG1575]|nr:ADP-ribose pyrophosphatase [Clostridiaceae bacterium JG1575]